MNLLKIEKRLLELNEKRGNLYKEFERNKQHLNSEISDLERLKTLGLNNFDVSKIGIAESVLEFGNGFKRKHKGTIERAINDATNDFETMKKEYFGIKDYSGFSNQEVRCQYGYGPKHGYVVFSIGLKKDDRQKEFTDEEKDACIYYLNHLINNKDFFAPLNHK